MKYYVKLHNGDKYEIDKLDYNHVKHRIVSGRTNGFYVVRGETNKDLSFAFQYFMTLETEGKERPKDKTVRDIDPEKFAPPLVGKPKVIPKGCQHDWNNLNDWEYVFKNIGGKIQYRKMCKSCQKTSMLVKPKEVENFMETRGLTMDDVKENKATTGQLPK